MAFREGGGERKVRVKVEEKRVCGPERMGAEWRAERVAASMGAMVEGIGCDCRWKFVPVSE